MTAPFYDPLLDYDTNCARGPFGPFAEQAPPASAATAAVTPAAGTPAESFLGIPVHTAFGIPAGPLVTGAFVSAAFLHGFDLCVYKTVRSGARPANPFPNILAVHPEGDLTLERASRPLIADSEFGDPEHLSISNSFGVPSRSPDVWQPDLAAAVRSAGHGQVLIAGFQGTRGEHADEAAYVADHVRTARLAAEAGAQVLELNLSCPNEGAASLLCFDTPLVARIVAAVKEALGDIPLVVKLAYFANDAALADLVAATAGIVDGYSAINTIPAPLVTAGGDQALPGAGRLVSGVCGDAIRWAGLEMVGRLAAIRERLGVPFTIVGVGGVMSAEHDAQYRAAGADAVMSATGAMWRASLGAEVRAAHLARHAAARTPN